MGIFFVFVGNELGRLLEISPATIAKENLSKAWIKVASLNIADAPSMLEVGSPVGRVVISMTAFTSMEVPISAITSRRKYLGPKGRSRGPLHHLVGMLTTVPGLGVSPVEIRKVPFSRKSIAGFQVRCFMMGFSRNSVAADLLSVRPTITGQTMVNQAILGDLQI